jgi:ubiquinone/menaquinone biosynthesis C-methylase UbiE
MEIRYQGRFAMTALASRGRFEGVAKIIRFNTRFYLGSALGVVGGVLVLTLRGLPMWLKAAVMVGTALILFWTVSSLVVSWYVYDHARVMQWEWMRSSVRHVPSRWANIHAGLDESTASLRHLLPGTDGVVIDIYDPHTMTEPSIARARRMYSATESFEIGSAKALPLPDADCDAVFLLFAAHELRDPEDRTQLLREAHRVLKNDGRIFLVEHLRDLPNFVAFGPGFLHFQACRSWLRSIGEARFAVTEQRGVTPFVRCFTLRKADA